MKRLLALSVLMVCSFNVIAEDEDIDQENIMVPVEEASTKGIIADGYTENAYEDEDADQEDTVASVESELCGGYVNSPWYQKMCADNRRKQAVFLEHCRNDVTFENQDIDKYFHKAIYGYTPLPSTINSSNINDLSNEGLTLYDYLVQISNNNVDPVQSFGGWYADGRKYPWGN